jgi:hypothetical protein
MTQEEKEMYYAVLYYNVGGIKMMSRIAKSDFLESSNDDIIEHIKDCVKYDMEDLKKKIDEVSKVSDNLDSE